jgi:dynein heavy chain
MMSMFDSVLMREYKIEDAKLPKEFDEMVPNVMLFAIIWSFGGALDDTVRDKFDNFLQELILGDDVNTKYELDLIPPSHEEGTPLPWEPKKLNVKLGEFKSLFDLYYDKEKLVWLNWIKTIPPYIVPKDVEYTALIVPTIDSIRICKLMNILSLNNQHSLFCGPTGTGKTISIAQELRGGFDPEEYTSISLSFSAQTGANQTQRIIDGKMEKRRKGVFGPPLGKQGIIFVDDLNMPLKEKYGAQPPIELLRQWMDYEGWYDIDTNEKDFRVIKGIKFVAAMGPPGGGRNHISARYVSHFNVLYVGNYSADSLAYVFNNVLEWLFLKNSNPSFSKPIQGLRDNLVSSTVMIYKRVSEDFRPTPAKSHYTYNLRDVSKVFQGIARSSPKGIRAENEMIKLWAHEVLRVFADRLIDQEDRDKFDILLKDVLKDKFKREWDKLVEVEPLLFGSFVPTIYPDNDKTKKAYVDVYCELTDRDRLKEIAQQQLDEYNNFNNSKKMNLVLFLSAIEHIIKIHRVINTPYGNSLLVGVGGSGRKSLTELATFISTFESYSIEISKNYGTLEWRDDMRNLMIKCGVDAKSTIFLLSDTQIVNEAFVEDINNILNNGEIPNLFALPDDMNNVMEGMREVLKGNPKTKNLSESEQFLLFIQRSRENLHVVMAFSPIGEDFRRRLRMFPSLVNCTTIDWFLPWPKEALQSVAEYFLENVELDNREGIVSICVDMQVRARETSIKYRNELRRFYYVTPTSYLELIKTFTELLKKKRMEINSVIDKFTKGLDQLANAQTEVAKLQIELRELEPKLAEAEKATGEMMVDITKQKKEVAEKTTEVEAEEAVAKEKSESSAIIEADCKNELARVEPIYKAAISAVKELDKSDIVEIRGVAKPSDGVKLVAKSLCILFNVKPDKIRGQTAKEGTQLDYWIPCQKKLLTPQLLKNCIEYDKDNIPLDVIKNMVPVVESPDYSDEVLKNASKAAAGLAKWVRAIVQYDEAMKIVKPKKEQLAVAQESSREAKRIWDEARASLQAIEEKMKKLIDAFEEAENKKARLQNEKDDCSRKLSRAGSLIEKLAGENENWKDELANNKAFREHLVGDVLISSGIVAYLGVFTTSYRNGCIDSWIELLKKFNILSTDDFSLQVVLGD